MKRFEKSTCKKILPIGMFDDISGLELVAQSRITGRGASDSGAGCLRCPDTPCIYLSDDQMAKQTRIDSVVSLERRVCPTDSLRLNENCLIEVDDSCIGCGLCIAFCPVNAIHLDVRKMKAKVASHSSSYKEFNGSDQDFFDARKYLSSLFESLESRKVDSGHIVSVLQKLSPLRQSPDGNRALQILIRNVFLLKGAAARLKNQGDNNNWAELGVDDGSNLFPIEIETAMDGLDSARRVTSDVAIVCNRYQVSINEVIPVVVMFQIPNIRTDYYEVVADTARRLGVRILTVPISLMVLSIFDKEMDLIDLIKSHCYIDSGNVRSSRVPEIFGVHLSHNLALALGILPPK
jgi:NAD-dependent dihydropyrimidine dehydrogenase PreA subunit